MNKITVLNIGVDSSPELFMGQPSNSLKKVKGKKTVTKSFKYFFSSQWSPTFWHLSLKMETAGRAKNLQ